MEHQASVLKKVANLEHMDLKQLRLYWVELWKTEPPKTYKVVALRKRLAYRIQELAYGGVNEQVKKRVDALYAAWVQQNAEKKSPRTVVPMPVSGSVIAREYQGVVYEVKVINEKSYEYNGRQWKSLTAIAREITGTHWNGPAFFGLRSRRRPA